MQWIWPTHIIMHTHDVHSIHIADNRLQDSMTKSVDKEIMFSKTIVHPCMRNTAHTWKENQHTKSATSSMDCWSNKKGYTVNDCLIVCSFIVLLHYLVVCVSSFCFLTVPVCHKGWSVKYQVHDTHDIIK